MQLSEHFTLEELTFSSTAIRYGIRNEPSTDAIAALHILAAGLERVRGLLGHPMHIDSGYRGAVLNQAVGGSRTSAHMSGYAADFVCAEFGAPLEIVKAIETSALQFDQLIQEGTWVHISFAPAMRREVLTAHFTDGKVSYTQGV